MKSENVAFFLRGAMSLVESFSKEVEEDSTAARNTLSSSYLMFQQRQDEEAVLHTEPSDGPPDGFFSLSTCGLEISTRA